MPQRPVMPGVLCMRWKAGLIMAGVLAQLDVLVIPGESGAVTSLVSM
jgi:3-hydroxymyristoyl/3-hydroxydecanoyl-(acyl carrier protein) dehydratase